MLGFRERATKAASGQPINAVDYVCLPRALPEFRRKCERQYWPFFRETQLASHLWTPNRRPFVDATYLERNVRPISMGRRQMFITAWLAAAY